MSRVRARGRSKRGSMSGSTAAFVADGNPRAATVRVMVAVAGERGSFRDRLPEALATLAPAERSRCRAWCYGLARYHVALAARLQPLLAKPLKSKDSDLGWLLQLGLYQLEHNEVPAPLVVSETVEAVENLDKSWARGFVNAVLRRAVREREEGSAPMPASDAERYAMPDWIYRRLVTDWGEHAPALAVASNQQAGMCLRLARESAFDAYTEDLASKGMNATRGQRARAALWLESPVEVEALPGFTEGYVSVQDESAQLAVELLAAAVPAGTRLLDACAAPGGKTAQAADTGHFAQIHALDQSSTRLTLLQRTLERCSHADAVTVVNADAADISQWWDGVLFGAVLLDAPCSGSGVIRRHTDIKLLRDEEDVAELVHTQARLLDAVWEVLAPGGHLLYTTCSIFKTENEDQIARFIARTPDAVACPLEDRVGFARPQAEAPLGRQYLPGDAREGDGFWYALITRTTGRP